LEQATAALERDDAAGARAAAQEALADWRGIPLSDLGDLPEAVKVRRRLDEVHRSLENLRLRATIMEGSDSWAVPEAERLVAATPHDEHRWVLLIQALDLAGRRGDALGAFERARRALAEGSGLSPGPGLLAAEAAVLHTTDVGANGGPGRLIGRSDLVSSALGQLHSSGVVVLVGEPGVGKTRMLHEVCGLLRRDGHAVARCAVSWHPSSPIAPLIDLAEDLGVGLDPGLPPVSAFRDALTGLVPNDRPTVVCIDDVDRAGPTSVTALLDAASLAGVWLVASATDTQMLPTPMKDSVLVVPNLDRDQLRELVTARTEVDRPEPSLLSWLLGMSGGNPMLVEYLIENPVALTRDSRKDPHDPVPSPELRNLIRARTRRLGAESLAALETAAVCGPTSRRDLVTAMAPVSGVTAAIAAALLEETIDDASVSWLTFRHGAVQRTIYDDLPPGRRTEIHYRAVEVLESLGAPAGTIATHAVAAAGFDPISAAGHAMTAAQAATTLGAHAEAATWYDRAVGAAEIARDSGIGGAEHSRVAAMVGRADALRLAGSTDQETALFAAAEAAFSLGDPEIIGDAAFAVLQLGATTESGAMHARAIDIADRSLVVVTDPDQRSMISAAASLTHSMTGASDRCRVLFLEAESQANSSLARRHVLPFAYLALGHPSDLALRERLTGELIELGRSADDPVAMFEGHQLSFSIGLMRNDGALVRDSLSEQAELVERVGDIGRRWSLQYQRAAVAHLDADFDAAEQQAEMAYALFSDVSPSRAFAAYGAQMLPIRIAQGRVEELLDTLETLVTDQPGVPAWHAALALGLAPTDPARAHDQALAALEDVPEDFTWLAAHIIGGRAAAAVGDVGLCDAYYTRLAPWSGLGCWQGTCSYGPVDAVLGQLATASARYDDAARLGGAALEQCERLGAPVFAEELRVLLSQQD
jgi:tetratricopeptide (TPR) repeat protein